MKTQEENETPLYMREPNILQKTTNPPWTKPETTLQLASRIILIWSLKSRALMMQTTRTRPRRNKSCEESTEKCESPRKLVVSQEKHNIQQNQSNTPTHGTNLVNKTDGLTTNFLCEPTNLVNKTDGLTTNFLCEPTVGDIPAVIYPSQRLKTSDNIPNPKIKTLITHEETTKSSHPIPPKRTRQTTKKPWTNVFFKEESRRQPPWIHKAPSSSSKTTKSSSTAIQHPLITLTRERERESTMKQHHESQTSIVP